MINKVIFSGFTRGDCSHLRTWIRTWSE